MKKGQVTIFIIIGLVMLFLVGTYLYMSGEQAKQRIAIGRPQTAKLPEQLQPIRDAVEACIKRLAVDGLRRVGEHGGYVDVKNLIYNPYFPTDGEAVQFSPDAGPVVAYWWYMKADNECQSDCDFGTKRPPLSRKEGGLSVEYQLDEFVNNNLEDCFGSYELPGCTVQPVDKPAIQTTVAESSVLFTGKYPIRATCEGSSTDIDDYYVEVELNLREIYNLATNITNLQNEYQILEQATKTVIDTFSGLETGQLPPMRALEFSGPAPGKFWIKYDVQSKLKRLLMSYIPLIQVFGTLNYNYITAPPGTNDPELYELLYNRQFLIPLNDSHPTLEARFSYLDWWEPYFDLNCNGQLCQADSGNNFFLLPFTINRYEFAYDLSYPVLIEIRNPSALGGQGYSLKFFLEENLRNSQTFTTNTTLPAAIGIDQPPSIFCDPIQRTSGMAQIYVKSAENNGGLNDVSVSYLCGEQNCNLGMTVNGTFTGRFPRCVGGALRFTKPEYATLTKPFDTFRETVQNVTYTMEPIRTLKATMKNLAIKKESKQSPWKFDQNSGLLRPKGYQQTIVMMRRKGTPYDESFSAVADIKGAGPTELRLIPGKYEINLISLLHTDIVIPPDSRCFKVGSGGKKKCQMVPEKAIVFNATAPFPYGSSKYEYELTSDMLRGAKQIEFREYVLAIDQVEEADRTVDDLGEMQKIDLYSQSNPILIWPVITK